MKPETTGSFTLPGEAGYESLTLELAQKWGADIIRDSDGTELSKEILDSGYGIYSTICIIREHNDWGKLHPETLQQTFLCTSPTVATTNTTSIYLMEDFFADQFLVNDTSKAIKYWQVYDRTTGTEISTDKWEWNRDNGAVTITSIPFHSYTVSFLAYRVWEEISMYNHVTNSWDKEHLMPIDPCTVLAQEYLYNWLQEWCEKHPETTVVRFTSMFYNFVWIWGSDERNRNLFNDWGSYDFTVSETALENFEKQYGYTLSAEDFINKGDFHVTHMPPSKHQLDYMEFVQKFVAEYGSKLVSLVQSYGKMAYVFYDDSWIGVEPYGPHFGEFGFDGIIKCVFSGFETRLCADVGVETHEIRLHPYLFPVGLGGLPTFSEGGNPTRDAEKYWINVRRALLCAKIDRIGLGGYLHFLKDYPDFVDYIEKIAQEFRTIKALHESGSVYTLPITVAVLHSWGKLRAWTLSGHFHETDMHDLIHILEALSGLHVNVKFISFDDVNQQENILNDVDVIINAGAEGTAWSGGSAWKNERLVVRLTQWVYEGGIFLGVNEPSAVSGYNNYFRMADILGVDKSTIQRVCHGKWQFKEEEVVGLLPEGSCIPVTTKSYVNSETTHVLATKDGCPTITSNSFGKGTGLYLSGFTYSPENTRLLLNLLLWAKKMPLDGQYLTDDSATECAWFPKDKCLVLYNNTSIERAVSVKTEFGIVKERLEPNATKIVTL